MSKIILSNVLMNYLLNFMKKIMMKGLKKNLNHYNPFQFLNQKDQIK